MGCTSHKNANLKARKGTALASVGVGSDVGCVGMAPPEVRFCALSCPNDQASVLGAPGLSPYVYYIMLLGEMSIEKTLICIGRATTAKNLFDIQNIT
jgi:hypothetical protein